MSLTLFIIIIVHMSITKNNKIEASDITTSLEAVNTQITAIDNKLGNYLPLGGGTMTGAIVRKGLFVQCIGTENEIGLRGGQEYKQGGDITLCGIDHPTESIRGGVLLRGFDSSGASTGLLVKSDGVTINNNPILTSAGGSLNGSLTFANDTWNLVGDDAYIGDHNIAGCIGIKSNNSSSGVGILFVNQAETVKRQLVMDNNGNLYWNGGLIPTASSNPYVTATYSSGTNWYRKWSDGWIEQGGRTGTLSDTSTTVTFPTAFTSTNYTLLSLPVYSSFRCHTWAGTLTNSTAELGIWAEDGSGSGQIQWYACGK